MPIATLTVLKATGTSLKQTGDRTNPRKNALPAAHSHHSGMALNKGRTDIAVITSDAGGQRRKIHVFRKSVTVHSSKST